MDMISIEDYEELFDHDVDAGKLWWKPLRVTEQDQKHYQHPAYPAERILGSRNTEFAGKPVGLDVVSAGGYYCACIKTRHSNYKRLVIGIHRIIWEIGNQKKIPTGYIVDHMNADKLDNRLSNLRLLTRGENNRNQKSRDGLMRGVKQRNKKWQSQITVSKQFDTYEEACEHQRSMRQLLDVEHLYTAEQEQGIV